MPPGLATKSQAATKKNPKQSTRLGFLRCCLKLRLIGTGRRGVGGWGAARPAYVDERKSVPGGRNADHALVLIGAAKRAS
jgi:hypothetical protein